MNKCVVLLIFLGQKRVVVLMYEIRGTARVLDGGSMLEQLGLTVDYQKKQMKLASSDSSVGPKSEHLRIP